MKDSTSCCFAASTAFFYLLASLRPAAAVGEGIGIGLSYASSYNNLVLYDPGALPAQLVDDYLDLATFAAAAAAKNVSSAYSSSSEAPSSAVNDAYWDKYEEVLKVGNANVRGGRGGYGGEYCTSSSDSSGVNTDLVDAVAAAYHGSADAVYADAVGAALAADEGTDAAASDVVSTWLDRGSILGDGGNRSGPYSLALTYLNDAAFQTFVYYIDPAPAEPYAGAEQPSGVTFQVSMGSVAARTLTVDFSSSAFDPVREIIRDRLEESALQGRVVGPAPVAATPGDDEKFVPISLSASNCGSPRSNVRSGTPTSSAAEPALRTRSPLRVAAVSTSVAAAAAYAGMLA